MQGKCESHMSYGSHVVYSGLGWILSLNGDDTVIMIESFYKILQFSIPDVYNLECCKFLLTLNAISCHTFAYQANLAHW